MVNTSNTHYSQPGSWQNKSIAAAPSSLPTSPRHGTGFCGFHHSESHLPHQWAEQGRLWEALGRVRQPRGRRGWGDVGGEGPVQGCGCLAPRCAKVRRAYRPTLGSAIPTSHDMAPHAHGSENLQEPCEEIVSQQTDANFFCGWFLLQNGKHLTPMTNDVNQVDPWKMHLIQTNWLVGSNIFCLSPHPRSWSVLRQLPWVYFRVLNKTYNIFIYIYKYLFIYICTHTYIYIDRDIDIDNLKPRVEGWEPLSAGSRWSNVLACLSQRLHVSIRVRGIISKSCVVYRTKRSIYSDPTHGADAIPGGSFWNLLDIHFLCSSSRIQLKYSGIGQGQAKAASGCSVTGTSPSGLPVARVSSTVRWWFSGVPRTFIHREPAHQHGWQWCLKEEAAP